MEGSMWEPVNSTASSTASTLHLNLLIIKHLSIYLWVDPLMNPCLHSFVSIAQQSESGVPSCYIIQLRLRGDKIKSLHNICGNELDMADNWDKSESSFSWENSPACYLLSVDVPFTMAQMWNLLSHGSWRSMEFSHNNVWTFKSHILYRLQSTYLQ